MMSVRGRGSKQGLNWKVARVEVEDREWVGKYSE